MEVMKNLCMKNIQGVAEDTTEVGLSENNLEVVFRVAFIFFVFIALCSFFFTSLFF